MRQDRLLHLSSMATLLLIAACLAACAPMVPSAPANLSPQPASVPAKEVRLLRATDIKLSTGYSRTLPARSAWRAVGRLAQGDVYRPLDTVLTVEGRQVHEAYLVINGTTLVGFFLPAESNYSPLLPTIPLTLEATP